MNGITNGRRGMSDLGQTRDWKQRCEALEADLAETREALALERAGYAWKERVVAAEAERDEARREMEFMAGINKALLPYQDRAVAAETEAKQLREAASKVTTAYTAEAEDHNDGEFALWKADDLINAIVDLRAALEDTP